MEITQLFVYGLLIAGFLLFNFLLQRAAQRARQRQEHERAQQQEAPLAREIEPIDSGWGHAPNVDRHRRSAVASAEATRRAEADAAAAAPPPRRPSPRALFRSTHDLRRAIVVMTVLGPCRALEPHDRR